MPSLLQTSTVFEFVFFCMILYTSPYFVPVPIFTRGYYLLLFVFNMNNYNHHCIVNTFGGIFDVQYNCALVNVIVIVQLWTYPQYNCGMITTTMNPKKYIMFHTSWSLSTIVYVRKGKHLLCLKL